jgi:putative membrane protein
MRYLLVTTLLTSSALVSGVAMAQQTEAKHAMKSADTSFATKAAQGGMAEVQLGELAGQRAAKESVKQFAQQMVNDHSKANDEFKALATNKGIDLPSGIDTKSQQLHTRLSALNGDAFDRAYMQAMVADHREDVAEFQKEANHGTDPELKAFAAKTLPTLQQHLRMAQEALADVTGGHSQR